MSPMRSTKYRMYRRSKYQFPTIFPMQQNQRLIPGSERALRSIEGQLGRKLHDDAKKAHTWSQWVWKEPR